MYPAELCEMWCVSFLCANRWRVILVFQIIVFLGLVLFKPLPGKLVLYLFLLFKWSSVDKEMWFQILTQSLCIPLWFRKLVCKSYRVKDFLGHFHGFSGSEILTQPALRITALPSSPPTLANWAVLWDGKDKFLVVLNSKKNLCFISRLA